MASTIDDAPRPTAKLPARPAQWPATVTRSYDKFDDNTTLLTLVGELELIQIMPGNVTTPASVPESIDMGPDDLILVIDGRRVRSDHGRIGIADLLAASKAVRVDYRVGERERVLDRDDQAHIRDFLSVLH